MQVDADHGKLIRSVAILYRVSSLALLMEACCEYTGKSTFTEIVGWNFGEKAAEASATAAQ